MNIKITSAVAAIIVGSATISAVNPSDLKDPAFAHYSPEQLDSINTESFIERTPLKRFYTSDQLRKIKDLPYKAFDKEYELEGLNAYDSKINDLYTDVYYVVNTGAEAENEHNFFSYFFKEPQNAKKELISVCYVIELDGTVGPVYISKAADKRNKKAIVDALRKLRYSKPATYNGKPVRSVSAFTLRID